MQSITIAPIFPPTTSFTDNRTYLHTLADGDKVFYALNSIGIEFIAPRNTLSTSIIGGGCRFDLCAVFNHNIGTTYIPDVPAYLAYLENHAALLGFEPQKISGMGTAAAMKNAVIGTAVLNDLVIECIITAGTDSNAGRVGDSVIADSADSSMPAGTINIILNINAALPPGTLARTLVTCTEAKTAALQELMIGSCFSDGLATGTGTDQVILITNPASPITVSDVGKHSSTGELIGRMVIAAVKTALYSETGMNAAKQHSVLRRLQRFGTTENRLYLAYCSIARTPITPTDFARLYKSLDNSPEFVTLTSLFVHLIDQYRYGLISFDAVINTANSLALTSTQRCDNSPIVIQGNNTEELISAWERLLAWCAVNN